MKKSPPTSITVEEAVSRMVNMDYIPTGFSLIEMTEAFLEEAEVDYHNAKVDRVPPEDLKIFALRVDVCHSRRLLAISLLDHIKQELANPKTSTLIISPENTSSTRLELKSVANWSAEKYGISIPDWFCAEDDANVAERVRPPRFNKARGGGSSEPRVTEAAELAAYRTDADQHEEADSKLQHQKCVVSHA